MPGPERAAAHDDIAEFMLEFGVQLVTDATVASFAGDIDMATHSRFTGALSLLLNDGAQTLILDLSQVRFISARGVLALVEAIERARGKDIVVQVHLHRVVTYTAETLGVSDTLSGAAMLPGTRRSSAGAAVPEDYGEQHQMGVPAVRRPRCASSRLR